MRFRYLSTTFDKTHKASDNLKQKYRFYRHRNVYFERITIPRKYDIDLCIHFKQTCRQHVQRIIWPRTTSKTKEEVRTYYLRYNFAIVLAHGKTDNSVL